MARAMDSDGEQVVPNEDGPDVKAVQAHYLRSPSPSRLHISLTLLHTKPGVAEQLLKDIRESISEIMKDPKAKVTGVGAIYGLAQAIPDRSIVTDMSHMYLDAVYSTESHTSSDKLNNGSPQ